MKNSKGTINFFFKRIFSLLLICVLAFSNSASVIFAAAAGNVGGSVIGSAPTRRISFDGPQMTTKIGARYLEDSDIFYGDGKKPLEVKNVNATVFDTVILDDLEVGKQYKLVARVFGVGDDGSHEFMGFASDQDAVFTADAAHVEKQVYSIQEFVGSGFLGYSTYAVQEYLFSGDYNLSTNFLAETEFNEEDLAHVLAKHDDLTDVNQSVTFVQPKPISVTIEAQKEISGRSFTDTDRFKFELTRNSEYGPEFQNSTNSSQSVRITDKAHQKVEFDKLVFQNTGTYHLILREQIDAEVPKVEDLIYSNPIGVFVTVGNDKEGNLVFKKITYTRSESEKEIEGMPVVINEAIPEITTSVTAGDSSASKEAPAAVSIQSSSASVSVTDRVTYKNLGEKKTYRLVGVLKEKNGSVVAVKVGDTFTANGTKETTVDFGAVTLEAGKEYIVYEYLFDGNETLATKDQSGAGATGLDTSDQAKVQASHENDSDKAQTIVVTKKETPQSKISVEKVWSDGSRDKEVLVKLLKKSGGIDFEPVIGPWEPGGTLEPDVDSWEPGEEMEIEMFSISSVLRNAASAGEIPDGYEVVKDSAGKEVTLTLNAANEYKGAFEGLPQFEKDGKTEIEYKIMEVAVQGYTTEITGDSKTGFVITNQAMRLGTAVKAGESSGAEKQPAVVELESKSDRVAVSDKVSYTNLENGKEYKLVGVLKEKGGHVVAVKVGDAFAANSSKATELDFGKVVLEAGKEYIVYEYLFNGDETLATKDQSGADAAGLDPSDKAKVQTSHEDDNDRAQTIIVTKKGEPLPPDPLTPSTFYTVTYDLNGGTDTGIYGDVRVPEGQAVTLAAAPSRSGYSFTGWSDGTTIYQAGASITVHSNMKFTAQWSKDSSTGGGSSGGSSSHTTHYTLHYESNGGSKYKDERYPRNTVVKLKNIPTREGYTFTGWYGNDKLTERLTEVKMTSNKTVYAGWKATGVPDWLNGDSHFAYVGGYPDGMVKPLNNITRAEVASIFFRLLNKDIRESNLTNKNTFVDVTEGMWYNTSVSTMEKLGVIKGRSAERFDPNASITRAEFAAICARFDTANISAGSNFTDLSGHWAKTYIERASNLGWIRGYSDGTFRPDHYITRAEAMTMINRMLNRLPETEADLLEGMKVWPDNRPGDWYYIAVQEATNSHEFVRKDQVHERWVKLISDPTWWTKYEI